MAGIKITLRDPENATNLIHAEFATARSHPEIKELLSAIAKKDNGESLLARRRELAALKLEIANSEEELAEAEKMLNETTEALNNSSAELFDAIYGFIVAGFRLAGATDEMADKLASLVNIENLPELKAKSLFGAGSVDFTKGGDRQ